MKTILTISALLVWCSTGVAAEHAFDYGGQTDQSVTFNYERSLTLTIKDVNQLDWIYRVDIAHVRMDPMSFAIPDLATNVAGNFMVEVPRDKIDAANTAFRSRVVAFGQAELAKKNDAVAAALKGLGLEAGKIAGEVGKVLPEHIEPEHHTILVDPVRLQRSVDQVGGGGTLIITVKATPKELKTADGKVVVRGDYELKDDADKKAVEEHKVVRVFRVHFRPNKGLRTSFGPYFCGLSSRSYGKLATPDRGDTLVVTLTESSSVRYGLSFNWTADMFDLGKEWFLGAAWGVAFTPSRSLDEAVQGLIGLSFHREGKPGFLTGGCAFGIENSLAKDWEEGDVVDHKAEIPTVQSLEASYYLGIGFALN